jgi:cell division septal protein FtsQ
MKTRRTTNRRKAGRSSSRQHLLELNVRTASIKRQRRTKLGGLLWKISALVIFLALIAVGVRVASEKFFYNNPEYSLRHLVTHLHDVLTDEELISLTGLKPGENLFLLDIDGAKKKLDTLPEARFVSIERRLPDTIEVGIERRIPVFLISNPDEGGDSPASESFIPGKSFLSDREGVVMQPKRLSDEFLHLPVLTGLGKVPLVPGKKIEDERFTSAAALNEALSEIPEESFRIRSVDVTKPYAIVVTDVSNARFTFGTKDLPGQIERLRKLLAHCQETGRKIETANLMIQRNTPVTFVLTPETRSAKIAPVPAKKSPSK